MEPTAFGLLVHHLFDRLVRPDSLRRVYRQQMVSIVKVHLKIDQTKDQDGHPQLVRCSDSLKPQFSRKTSSDLTRMEGVCLHPTATTMQTWPPDPQCSKISSLKTNRFDILLQMPNMRLLNHAQLHKHKE
jgi:hypothetical protein